MGESLHLLSVDTPPHLQLDWITAESRSEGLTNLLVILWSDLHPLSTDLLYLVRRNARELRALMNWVEEYTLMHFLCCLYLNLKTWCFSIEEEAGYIGITSIYSLLLHLPTSLFNSLWSLYGWRWLRPNWWLTLLTPIPVLVDFQGNKRQQKWWAQHKHAAETPSTPCFIFSDACPLT